MLAEAPSGGKVFADRSFSAVVATPPPTTYTKPTKAVPCRHSYVYTRVFCYHSSDVMKVSVFFHKPSQYGYASKTL